VRNEKRVQFDSSAECRIERWGVSRKVRELFLRAEYSLTFDIIIYLLLVMSLQGFLTKTKYV